MDFRQAKDELLELVRRPKTQKVGSAGAVTTMDTVAGRQINAAIMWANRKHRFQYAEKTVEHTFPADTFTVARSAIGAGDIMSLKTVQRLSESGNLTGKPYKLMSYDWLQKLRMSWNDRTRAAISYNTAANNVPDLRDSNEGHQIEVNEQFEYYMFRMADGYGLYPTPTQAVTLLLHYNAKLPDLVNDSDTNFLLDFCWDFIYSKALKRFNIYLKEDERVAVSNDQIGEEWDSVITWDSEIVNAQQFEYDGEI